MPPPGGQVVASIKGKRRGHNTKKNNDNQQNVNTSCSHAGTSIGIHSTLSNIAVEPLDLHGVYRQLVNCKGGAGHSTPSLFVSRFSLLPYSRGITNSSNGCFINAVMQVLIHLPPFAQLAVSAINFSSTCPVLATLGKWFVQYWKPGLTRQCMQSPRLPIAMGSVKGAAATADGSRQEDAQEFLQRLLEEVHEELCKVEAEPAAGSASGDEFSGSAAAAAAGGDASNGGRKHRKQIKQQQQQFEQTNPDDMKGWTFVKGKEKLSMREHVYEEGQSLLLGSVFGGTIENHLKGANKQRDLTSVVVERYFSLPVDIGFAASCTMEEALVHTFSSEKFIDIHGRELRRTPMLGKMPNVLILQLRRWATTAEQEVVKLDNVVHLGRTLVIPPSICADSRMSPKARSYRLVSVTAHRGYEAFRGHYVTYLVNNVANPTNTSVNGSVSQGAGAGARSSCAVTAAASRHPLSGDTVILCNDVKITLTKADEMLKEAVYFAVYQRA